MGKKLITVEIKVVPQKNQVEVISANVGKIRETESAEIFQFTISQNEKIVYNESFVSSSLDLIKLKVVDELRNIIDKFDPAVTSISVLEDSHKIISKTEFRCPNCHRKLFESWGKAKGIVMKCKRCSSLIISGMQKV